MEEITRLYVDVDEAINDLEFLADCRVHSSVLIEVPSGVQEKKDVYLDWRTLSGSERVARFVREGFCSCHAPTLQEIEELIAPITASLDNEKVLYKVSDYHYLIPGKRPQYTRILEVTKGVQGE